jgi:hypothetical protein
MSQHSEHDRRPLLGVPPLFYGALLAALAWAGIIWAIALMA